MGWQMIVAGAVVLWFSVGAAAQTPESLFGSPTPCQQAMLESRAGKLREGLRIEPIVPFAGFSSDPYSFSVAGPCHVVAFYRVFDLTLQTREQRLGRAPRQIDMTPRFIARILSKGSEWSESWADQDSCPAIETALASLSSVVSPRFTGERTGDVESALPTDSGVRYALWSRDTFYPTEFSYDRYNLEVHSNTGTPIAGWIDSTLAQLMSCATLRRPVGL